MHRLAATLFTLFTLLRPATAQDDALPLAYLVREDDIPISFSRIWEDNHRDTRYAGGLPGEFGFREGVERGNVGMVRFGVDFAIGDYALSPDGTRLAFSAFDPVDKTYTDGGVYRGYDYGLFIYRFNAPEPSKSMLTRIDIDHPVDVIWSPEGDALLLPAVGIEGLPTPFYPVEPDTLIYDLTDETFYTLQAGDPPLFYVDGYDADFDVEGKVFYLSAYPPYIWLPDGRIVFQSGGQDCTDQCRSWKDLYIANHDGSNVVRLTHFANELSLENDVFIRGAVWSPLDERLYVAVHGPYASDYSAIYSLDLNGDMRREMSGTGWLHMLNMKPTDKGFYVVVSYADNRWAIQRLGGTPGAEETLYQHPPGATRPTLAAFSPAGRYAAVNDGDLTLVIDLSESALATTLQTGVVCDLRWREDTHFIYQSVGGIQYFTWDCLDKTNGLWKADIESGELTDLTERWGKPMRLLLPDTPSLRSSQ